MRIGWASPIHHASAIGRFSIGVAEALNKRGVEVDLLRTERVGVLGEPRLPSTLAVRELARMSDFGQLRDYDLLVYNIGDNAILHQYAVDALLQSPGLCIFHDLLILNLFNGWIVARGEEHRTAQVIDGLYGPATYSSFDCQPGRLDEAAAKYPMLEWLAPRALAAVAHGRHYLSRLTACCAGPVRHIPLAYDLPENIPSMRMRDRNDILRLATIGHVNENKLGAQIISALGRSKRLRRSCAYTLAGPISEDMRQQLGHLAKRLGVSLRMTGPLSRAELAKEIEHADALLCLRRPILEGASASAIEAMLAARPAIVLDHGFYCDLPDDLVLKIPAEFEDRDLANSLIWLLDNPAEASQLGSRAACWARETFSFDAYADAFLPLAQQAIEAEPLMRLSLQLGRELSDLGARPDGPEAQRIAQLATNLFCPGGNPCP